MKEFIKWIQLPYTLIMLVVVLIMMATSNKASERAGGWRIHTNRDRIYKYTM